MTRRVIWDGDQLLAEVQAPGQDSSLAAMEQDRGFHQAAAASVTPPETSLDGSVTSTATAYPGFYYGCVVYVHGGGIDHPLAIERMEYSDSLPGPFTIYPHENWKGAFDLGSYDGHTLNAPCKLLSDAGFVTPFQVFVPGDGSEVKPAPTDTTSHCLKVSWPAPHLWLTNRARDNNAIGQDAWNGSLVDGMRDASGQMYMRNRYYDPQSARFTQEDPIGIAGGLNVYGFAGGDPVSYSDPYGLWPAPVHDEIILAALKGVASSADIKALQSGSRWLDIVTQQTSLSYIHAMKSKGQSDFNAISKREEFKDNNMIEARDAQAAGNHYGAMRALSYAMHTVMDQTSPAHVDPSGRPRVWTLNPFSIRMHHAAESGRPTTAQMRELTRALRQMYNDVITASNSK